ncbi:MAG: biotin attachment protein [Betaproteobacteria bacterium]|nr:biotin attachment protein [Betaproteobacteria bacterium]
MEVMIKMPDLSTTDGSDILIVKWVAGVGDLVERGQVLLEVETDKAVQEVECIFKGTLTAQLAPAGAAVPVGAVIASIEVER